MVHSAAPSDPARRKFLFGTSGRPAEASKAKRVAVIAETCLAFQGIACMTCRDACLTGAIRFGLALGGARPRVDADACTGCAECAATCPVGAIALAAVPMPAEASGV